MAELMVAAGMAATAAEATATLATVGTIASIGGAGLSAIGAMQQGKAAKVSADFQARQAEQQAGQDRASAQRVAIEERRKANIAASNLRAAAGKSGGGATDATIMNLESGISQEGEYNALSALFTGEEKARSLQLQAASSRMEGKQAKRSGYISAGSTLIGGIGGTLMDKYGKRAS